MNYSVKNDNEFIDHRKEYPLHNDVMWHYIPFFNNYMYNGNRSVISSNLTGE
jgi:hypothetical protein